MERLHRHLEDQLDRISEAILGMGGLVESAIGKSMEALVDRRPDLAREVVREDEGIDRLELEIDHLCMEALALQQPLASDLRLVTTAMKITTDLERIGDLAVNISERAIELGEEPPLRPPIDIPTMAARAQEMLHGALDAYVRRDAGAARRIIGLDDGLDLRMEQLFRDLLAGMIEDPRTITRAIRLTFVAKCLERMGDQVTNVCEQVVYMAEGRVIKHPGARAAGGGPY